MNLAKIPPSFNDTFAGTHLDLGYRQQVAAYVKVANDAALELAMPSQRKCNTRIRETMRKRLIERFGIAVYEYCLGISQDLMLFNNNALSEHELPWLREEQSWHNYTLKRDYERAQQIQNDYLNPNVKASNLQRFVQLRNMVNDPDLLTSIGSLEGIILELQSMMANCVETRQGVQLMALVKDFLNLKSIVESKEVFKRLSHNYLDDFRAAENNANVLH